MVWQLRVPGCCGNRYQKLFWDLKSVDLQAMLFRRILPGHFLFGGNLFYYLLKKQTMKKIFYLILLITIAFLSCKKQSTTAVFVQTDWQKQLTDSDRAALDLNGALWSIQKGKRYYKYFFKHKDPAHDFLVEQTDSSGTYLNARFMHLERISSDTGLYNGSLILQTVKRVTVISSAIVNGYVIAWHPNKNAGTREQSFPVSYDWDEMPEFVVIGYPSSGGLSFSDFTIMEMMANGVPVNGAAGGYGNPAAAGSGNLAVYSPVNTSKSSNTTTTTHTTPGGIADVNLSLDDSYLRPAIDLDDWFKCFALLPDAGANYSVTLCADLPDDNDPAINVNPMTGATGHTFLQLTKSSGGQSATQVIGFTAQKALTAVLNPDDFVPSKVVDNAGHKYDASITMYTNTDGFNAVLEQMKLSAPSPYSIAHFDCLDYDLAVVNTIRGGIPLFLTPDPGSNIFSRISTGERLYPVLEDMKWAGGPEANNIIIGGPMWAGPSHGPCN
jgi:hypothetical protein